MPEGPNGVPRPLAEASLSINLYYAGDTYTINEERIRDRISSRLDNDPSGIVTAFNISDVEVSTFDILSSTSEDDTRISIVLSNPQGVVKRLVNERSSGDIMEISIKVINQIKQVVNAAVDDGPESVTISIR